MKVDKNIDDIKLLVLLGASGVGKDYVLNYIANNYIVNILLSDTTRPIRNNEIDGIDYNFISKDEFLANLQHNRYIENRSYNVINNNNKQDIWLYGTRKDSLLKGVLNIAILDETGLANTKHYLDAGTMVNGNIVMSVLLIADDEVRKKRAINRGNFNINEWNRRCISDSKKFKLANNSYSYVVNNTGSKCKTDNMIDNIMYKINKDIDMEEKRRLLKLLTKPGILERFIGKMYTEESVLLAFDSINKTNEEKLSAQRDMVTELKSVNMNYKNELIKAKKVEAERDKLLEELKNKPATKRGVNKLTCTIIKAIREEYVGGADYKAIAKKYSIGYYTVSKIVNKVTYKHC